MREKERGKGAVMEEAEEKTRIVPEYTNKY